MRRPVDLERLQRLLGAPELARIRRRLRARFERGATSDVFTLTALNAVERHALEALLGRPASASESMRLSQNELDAVLVRAQLAPDLRRALEALGGPIENRKAKQLDREQAWREIVGTEQDQRLHALLSTPGGRRLLRRFSAGDASRARALIESASHVLARLPARGVPLARLAAEALGDAHALDAGRPVATLVLHAAAEDVSAIGVGAEDAPADAPDAGESRVRSRWARLGVSVNELAAPVLCLNLRAAGDAPAAQLATRALHLGEPMHLSLRALLRSPPDWAMRGRDVFVCENPAVVAIAAEQLGARCASMVCTDGMPAAAQRVVLEQLGRGGARLRYHGDFDWPGVRIGNFVMSAFGALPWRFDAAHFCAHAPVRGRRLEGPPVVAAWDGALASAMERSGFALDEEAVIETLLLDLQ